MTYMERINRSPLTAKAKRRATGDAERLRKRGARRMLAKEVDVLRAEIVDIMNRHDLEYLKNYGLHGYRSPAVATWMAQV